MVFLLLTGRCYGAEIAGMHHSSPLEMPFPMVSLFVKFGPISFWPKAMDYSKAF